jgi:hypothetical protein
MVWMVQSVMGAHVGDFETDESAVRGVIGDKPSGNSSFSCYEESA